MLVLVEPVSEQLEEAARRLAPLASRVVVAGPDVEGTADDRFDLIIANHSLYYVADPAAIAAALLQRLTPGGRLIATMLNHGNALARIWKAGFAAAKMHFTFLLAEQMEAILVRLVCALKRETISNQIGFPYCKQAKGRIT